MKTIAQMLKGDILKIADETTAIADGEEDAKGTGYAKSVIFILDVTGIPAGYTDETLDVKVVNVDPKTGKEDDLCTFTQVTDTVSEQWKYTMDSNKALGNAIKVIWTITGSSPDYDFKVSTHLKHN